MIRDLRLVSFGQQQHFNLNITEIYNHRKTTPLKSQVASSVHSKLSLTTFLLVGGWGRPALAGCRATILGEREKKWFSESKQSKLFNPEAKINYSDYDRNLNLSLCPDWVWITNDRHSSLVDSRITVLISLSLSKKESEQEKWDLRSSHLVEPPIHSILMISLTYYNINSAECGSSTRNLTQRVNNFVKPKNC